MSFRNTSILFGVALVAAAVTPLANADQWDKRTTITINEAVEVPDCCSADHVVILQPGTYVIALAIASQSDRHTVRIFEQDGKTVVTTMLAVPNLRLKPTGKACFNSGKLRPARFNKCAPGFIPAITLARSSPITRR